MSVEASGGGASAGSSDKSGGNNVGDAWSIEIDQRFSEQEKERFISFEEASKVVNKIGNNVEPKIQKVPSMLRKNKNFITYFEPNVFSFGPYNRPLRTHKMAIQIKVNLTADFLRQNGVIKEDLYEDINKQIKGLKDCYDDELTKDYKDKDKDGELAWMFMVDGCAILQFICIFVDFGADPEMQFKNLGIKTDYAEFLAQDLFLLENQLPYQLLQLIMRRTTKEDKLLKSIYEFIFYRFRTSEEWSKNKNKILEDLIHNHVHLLDLLRTKLIQPLHQRDEIGLTCIPSDKLKRNRNELKRNRVLVPFRNTGKLREVGINLKCSKTSCVKDISFNGGTLKLPHIIVGESIVRMFLNMLCYEMCPDFHNGSEVSTYMYFMDKLIDQTQDVEELREKNILLNELGSDEEVVKLFNEIGLHLFPNDEIFSEVKWNIDNYFSNNMGHECRIGIDQINEGSSYQGFSEQEKKQFDSLEKAFEEIHKTGRPANAKPKIQRVPYKLRDNNKLKKYFQPKMFSFGPYSDYTDRTLEIKQIKMAKQIKVNLAAEFVHRNDVKKENLYEEIKKQIKDLKDCYDDDLTNDFKDKDHKLAWMFLVDGCAILQFMYISVDVSVDTQFRELGIKTDYAEFLAQDLFLLENQLPYQLLHLIMQHTSKEEELLKSIYKFIYFLFRTSFEWYLNQDKILKDHKHDHAHLLDLLGKRLIQPLHQKDHGKLYCWTAVQIGLIFSLIFFIIFIIYCLIVLLFDKSKCNRNEFDLDGFPVPFHNIEKLREAGINLKCSKTICVSDINFSCSTLKLPRIILVESTARIFLNILGYEMCPGFLNKSEVTTYIYILSKLIVQTRDVEELREKNILLNELGSDEEVVKLFNGISTHLIPNPELKIYSKVKRNIDDYFDNKGLVWLRKAFHDIHQYFRGRWSLLAFIGALLAVASSIIQTGITVLAYQADSKKGN